MRLYEICQGRGNEERKMTTRQRAEKLPLLWLMLYFRRDVLVIGEFVFDGEIFFLEIVSRSHMTDFQLFLHLSICRQKIYIESRTFP